MASRVSTFRIITFSLITLVLFALAVEGLVRLFGVDTYVQNRFFILNRALDYPEVFKKDRQLFWRFRTDRTVTSHFFEGRTYHINSLGLRGDEINKADNQPRIITLGNSCTFGWGIPDGRTYAEQLEARLDYRYEVINGGIPGYTSYQGKIFFERDLLKLKPQIVTILYCWNDHWAAASQIPDKDQKFPPQLILDIQNFFSRFDTYRLMKKLWLSGIEQNLDSLFNRQAPVYRVGPSDYYANLTEICRTARSNDIEPILLTSPIPHLDRLPAGLAGMYRFHQRYNDIIRRVAEDNQVPLVDLAAEFDKYTGLWDDTGKDWIHFNADGHLLAAELIAEFIGKSDSGSVNDITDQAANSN
ncbi:MAG: SGNH/GDSL hydrolase family protein [Candidatus Zixiibacteriota bacterium]|jgi:lysophospholipase L1-like esterase